MKQFSFNLKWYQILKRFSPAIRHHVIDALMEYMDTGKAPELKTAEAIAFEFIRTEIEERTQNLPSSSQPEDAPNNDSDATAPDNETEPDNEDDYDSEKTDNIIRIVPALNTYFSEHDPECCASVHSDLLRLEPDLHKELAVKVMFERATEEKTPIRDYLNHRILAGDLYDFCEPVVDALRPNHRYEYSEPITRAEWREYTNSRQNQSEDTAVT